MTSPLRIAHIADLHFGRRHTGASRDVADFTEQDLLGRPAYEQSQSGRENVREIDIYRAGHAVAAHLANVVKPDVVVIAGDLLDQAHPTPLAIRHALQFVSTLREGGMEVVVIGGNHDTVSAIGRPTPLQLLSDYFGCHVMLDQQVVEVGGVQFCSIPYRTLSSSALKPFDLGASDTAVLMAHATADGKGLPDFAKYDHTRLPNDVLMDSRFSVRMLGHIHIHGEIDTNALYCGALERLTWGELPNDPSIYLHEVAQDGTVSTESLRVADMGVTGVPRQVHDLIVECGDMNAGDALQAASAALEDLTVDDHLVRVTLQGAPADIYTHAHDNHLVTLGRRQGALAVKVRTKVRAATDAEAAESAAIDWERAPAASLSEHFRAFAKKQGVDPALGDVGAQLIAAATGELGE